MSNYVQKSALCGYGTKYKQHSNYTKRNVLISRLAQERYTPRILKAPNGYGKSNICYQYADVMFDFKHVFWLECSDVKFLRDLDKKWLYEEIIKCDKSVSLVIFDDLPYLNSERAEILYELINKLSDTNVEVLVTLEPINSPEIPFLNDYIFFSSSDLLVSDDEKLKSSYNQYFINQSDNNVSNFVPSEFFGNSAGNSGLLINNYSSNLPLGLKFLIFSAYIIQEGSLRQLSGFVNKSDINLFKDYCKEYVHIELHKDDHFICPRVDILNIANTFAKDINSFIDKYFKNKMQMYEKFVDMCIENNNVSRAYSISKLFQDIDYKKSILEQFYLHTLSDFEITQSCILVWDILANKNLNINNKIDIEEIINTDTLNELTLTLFSFNLLIMNFVQQSTLIAYTLLQTTKSKLVGLLCSLMFYVCGNKADKNSSKKLLKCYCEMKTPKNLIKSDIYYIVDSLSKMILSDNDIDEILNIVNSLSNFSRSQVRLYACSLILEFSQNNVSILYNENICGLIDTCLDYCLGNSTKNISLGTFWFLNNYLEIVTQHSSILLDSDDKIYKAKYLYSIYKSIVNNACNEYRRAVDQNFWNKNADSKGNLVFNNKFNIGLDSSDMSSETYSEILNLHINLFGGFQMSIGDMVISPDAYSRKKIKTLLAMLLLESGRNVSGSWIAKSLWPDQSESRARSNLSSLWVNTRKILKDNKDRCPYVFRVQNEFSINPKYVTSDIDDIDFLYESFSLSSPDPVLWVDIAKDKIDVIKGQLLPGETSNAYILRKREMFKNKILEALISAAERLSELKYYREALWFTRLALDVDCYCEDVYYTMMSIQYKYGKRSNAIETCIACRKFLEEEANYSISSKTRTLIDGIVNETV